MNPEQSIPPSESGDTVMGFPIRPSIHDERIGNPTASPYAELETNPVFQALFGLSFDAVLVFDDGGYCWAANAAASELLGIPPEALIRRRLQDFVPPECQSVEAWAQFWRDRQHTGQTRIASADGSLRRVMYRAIAACFAPDLHLAFLRDLGGNSPADDAENLEGRSLADMQQTLAAEQQAIQRERFITRLAQTIRQSLDLQTMLNATVDQVQQFLAVDRVLIYQFQPDWSGKVVAEAIASESLSLLHRVIEDSCFAASLSGPDSHPYLSGRIHRVNDVQHDDLSDCYRGMLTQLQVRAVLVIPIVVKDRLWGLLVSHHCTAPHQWDALSEDLLQRLSTQLAIGISQAELYRRTQQQAQKEQLVNQLIQAVRNSLDLQTVFANATTAIGEMLRLDRAELVRYQPAQSCWVNVCSYRSRPELPDASGLVIPDEDNPLAAGLKQLQVMHVDNLAEQSDPINQSYAPEFPGMWMLVPISRIGTAETEAAELRVWGALSLNYQQPSRQWQRWEMETVHAVVDQLAIAIQQASLYQSVQRLNDDLEHQVAHRTAQLQQALEFEALLKRITDKVRDSLDEAQILQGVVDEVGRSLPNILCCGTATYSPDLQSGVIGYEYTTRLPSAEGLVVQFADKPDLYRQLLAGLFFQFCRIEPDPVRQVQEPLAVLAFPVFDDQGILGDIWLFRECGEWFNDAEVRLVQQVATQCAIAIRQARLYQASQAQIEELERLNRLKDDFLSTVSHELRTPIAGIKMSIQLLEIHLNRLGILSDRSNPITRYFQILQDECQRESNLINNLLDLSHLDAEVDPLLPSEVHLDLWVPHVAEAFIEKTRDNQQQLSIDVADNLPPLVIDSSYLERILTELLTNACKYTPAGDRISVEARLWSRQRGQEQRGPSFPELNVSQRPSIPILFQICVTNTGVEIPEAERDRIFDRFYRIPSNDPWRHGGTGLGLALVKRLVERLGGAIALESRDGETCFVVTLPSLELPTGE
jgi:GAF domain-containing protein/PAS domain-containing protein/two-component sensor histidine kinase